MKRDTKKTQDKNLKLKTEQIRVLNTTELTNILGGATPCPMASCSGWTR